MAEQNPTRRLVPIDLDKRRHLLFDFNTLALIETLTERNMLGENAWDDLKAADIRAFLYAGLRHEDPALTLEQVGSLIHVGSVKQVAEALKKAQEVVEDEAEGPPVTGPQRAAGAA